MKTTIFTALFVVGALVFGGQFAQADFSADSSSDSAQDSPVVSDPGSDAAQDGPATVTSSPSTQPAQDGPGSGSSSASDDSSGNTSGGRRTRRASTEVGAVAGVATTSCPLVTGYLKLGSSNDPSQVTNLQIFLKNSEKLDVDVNGIFDQKTEDAVKSFQKKYIETILGPWDSTRATGFVYITTLKKINELACAQPLTLSADELAVIDEFKNRPAYAEVTNDAASTSDESLQLGDVIVEDVDNAAAAGEASILSRFWAFIVSLFR